MSILTNLIRRKFSGAYDDLDDNSLEQKVLNKYPQYADIADNPFPDPEPPQMTEVEPERLEDSFEPPSFLKRGAEKIVETILPGPVEFAGRFGGARARGEGILEAGKGAFKETYLRDTEREARQAAEEREITPQLEEEGFKPEFAKELAKTQTPIFKEQIMDVAIGATEPLRTGRITREVSKKVLPPIFRGLKNLSTKVVERLRGRRDIAKGELISVVNETLKKEGLKQSEVDLIRNLADEFEGRKIPVKDFAEKIQSELLPLEQKVTTPKFEYVNLPDELRGDIISYNENIYQSPIKTRAGKAHFSENEFPNYFAHTRVEDLAGKRTGVGIAETGDTRRVIEIQSDLFQKGGLEEEIGKRGEELLSKEDILKQNELSIKRTLATLNEKEVKELEEITEKGMKLAGEEFIKLRPYQNTWQERIIKEEVRDAVVDGKKKLQFPTGETAMKIEKLGGVGSVWEDMRGGIVESNLKIGKTILNQDGDAWLITEVLEDGRFKAIESGHAEDIIEKNLLEELLDETGFEPSQSDINKIKRIHSNLIESFSVATEIDTTNAIYKRYENDIGKYLQKKYNAKKITDPQGVEWWEVKLKKEMGIKPIEAFGIIPAITTQEELKNE